MKSYRIGLTLGVSAYLTWGLFPLYWPLLKPANSIEIVLIAPSGLLSSALRSCSTPAN